MTSIPRSIKIAKYLIAEDIPDVIDIGMEETLGTLDQARFTKEDLEEIKESIGTINIEAISEKDDPKKHQEYYTLYENNPGKGERYRSSRRTTGIHAYKDIGGKIVLIWRDAEIDDWYIVGPKGFLETLRNPNENRVNIIAKCLITAATNEFEINENYLQHPVTGYKNPTPKQLNSCIKYDQVRAILVGKDMYVWEEAIHRAAIKTLGLMGNSNIIPLNMHLVGNKIEAVAVTDFANNTKWKHNPKLKDAILKNKWIKLYADSSALQDPDFVNYYDTAINGPWHEMKAASSSDFAEEEVILPTIEEFLSNPLRNSYLNVPGFDSFYARKGPYYVDGKMHSKVFQIANLEATDKGQGTFSKLIADLKKKGMPIFVESILNKRLPAKLEELDFKQVNKNSGVHYFWDNAKSINASTNDKESFYKKHNIDEDEMHWLGSGDFGDAYDIGNNKALKITKSKEEMDIAKNLLSKNATLDGFVDYFAAEEVGNEYMIIMEMLDTPGSIEDKFNELQTILDEQDVPITYIDQYLDTDELDLDNDMLSFISDIEDVIRSYKKIGILDAADISPENLGYDKNKKLKAFDIFERT